MFAKKIINSLIPELSFETYSKVSDYMEIKTNVNHEDHIIRFGANARRKIKNEDKIPFVQNRLIIFDANKLHRGLSPNKNEVRITLAFKIKE